MEKYLIAISSSDIIIRIISLILLIKRIIEISNESKKNSIVSLNYIDTLNQNDVNINWSKILIFKFSINIILILLSLSIGIMFIYEETDICILDKILCNIYIGIYFLIEGIVWLFSSILLYKEAHFFRNQSWNGLRFFWFTNGLFSILKIISFVYYIIVQSEYNKIGIYILFWNSFFSLILFYYSIFRPYDFSYQPAQLINKTIENKEVNAELNSISISNSDSILDFNEDLLYDDLSDEEILYKITINNEAFNLFLKLKTNDFSKMIFIINVNNDKYNKQKTPSEITKFFLNLIKCYKNKNYGNNILNLVQQSYNISLTLNPKKNSFTGKKENLNTLSHLCNESIKTSNNYLLDLLLFLDLSNINLVQTLQNNNIESVLEEFQNIEEENSNNEDNLNEISKRKTLNNINNAILENSNNNISVNNKKIILNSFHQISRDLIKSYTFFNNILTKEKFISIKVVKYNEDQSEIECILKTSNPNKEVAININSENLVNILYNNELLTYYVDNINTMIEKNDFSIFELLLNDYLNNLIYYDEKLFNEFKLNKILNLDIEKFDVDLLINFFEKDNLECANDITNMLFDIVLQPINEINDKNNIFNINFELKGVDKKNVIDDNNKEINMDLNLVKLYIIIDGILPVINSYLKKNFNQLYSVLNEIKTNIENYMYICLDIDADIIKKIKTRSQGEIDKVKFEKMLFGHRRIDEICTLIEAKLFDGKSIDDINLKKDDIIPKINEKIKELNKSISTLLNNKSLKYILFFSSIRDIFGISKLF